MNNKILQSIIDITRQRDMDSLEYSLAITLSEIANISEFVIYKFLDKNLTAGMEVALHLSIEKDKEGKADYHWHRSENDTAARSNPLFEQFINSNESAIEKKTDSTIQLLLPLKQSDITVGIISISSHDSLTAHRPLIDGLIYIYSNYLTLLHENETDKLTGLYNRRTFDHKLNRLLIDQKRKSRNNNKHFEGDTRIYDEHASAWLAGLDIDHFKHVNDTFGHVYGDEVLLLLAQEMKQHFRREDIIFRFGGEEFIIILSSTSLKNAHAALERFRSHIENFTFPQVGKITISLGFAKITDQDFPPDILEKADKALYYVKENGRNKTCCYETLIAQGELTASNKTGSVELF